MRNQDWLNSLFKFIDLYTFIVFIYLFNFALHDNVTTSHDRLINERNLIHVHRSD